MQENVQHAGCAKSYNMISNLYKIHINIEKIALLIQISILLPFYFVFTISTTILFLLPQQ